MSERKILFTDLDGTLLSDDKTISEKNTKAVKEALDKGHYVTVATGRAVESARHVVRKLGLTLPGCYVIAYNGAVIYDSASDRILMEKKVPMQYVQHLIEKADEAGIYIQAYSNRHVLTRVHTKELSYYCQKTKMPYKIVPSVLDALTEETNKVLLIELDDKKKLERFQKENLSWSEDKLSSFFSCDEYLEYCPLDTTKGSAISYLCNFLNIPIKNTIAVGDERNDISMLEAAQLGVAVKNAKEEVRSAAELVTENDNNHDAIAEIIEKYML